MREGRQTGLSLVNRSVTTMSTVPVRDKQQWALSLCYQSMRRYQCYQTLLAISRSPVAIRRHSKLFNVWCSYYYCTYFSICVSTHCAHGSTTVVTSAVECSPTLPPSLMRDIHWYFFIYRCKRKPQSITQLALAHTIISYVSNHCMEVILKIRWLGVCYILLQDGNIKKRSFFYLRWKNNVVL